MEEKAKGFNGVRAHFSFFRLINGYFFKTTYQYERTSNHWEQTFGLTTSDGLKHLLTLRTMGL